MKLTFRDIPKKKVKKINEPRILMWNTNKEEGGDKYRLLTSKNNLLTSVYKEHDPNKIMKLIEKETESI